MDKLYKYIYANDVKVQVLVLSECVVQAARSHNLTVGGRISRIAAAECFAGILGAELKDAEASVYVSMKLPAIKTAYNAVAYGDGRICASEMKYVPPSSLTDGMVIESVLHNPATGDYSSVVCGKQVVGAINAYINESMQRKAKYKMFRDGNVYYAVFAEALPGSRKLGAAWKALKSPLFMNVDLGRMEQSGFRLIQTRDISYGCNCSRRSVKRALLSAGGIEDGSDSVETVCNYCGKKYVFTREDLEN